MSKKPKPKLLKILALLFDGIVALLMIPGTLIYTLIKAIALKFNYGAIMEFVMSTFIMGGNNSGKKRFIRYSALASIIFWGLIILKKIL